MMILQQINMRGEINSKFGQNGTVEVTIYRQIE